LVRVEQIFFPFECLLSDQDKHMNMNIFYVAMSKRQEILYHYICIQDVTSQNLAMDEIKICAPSRNNF